MTLLYEREKATAVDDVRQYSSIALADFMQRAFDEGYSMTDVRGMLKLAIKAIDEHKPKHDT